jgi:hypothetical protein
MGKYADWSPCFGYTIIPRGVKMKQVYEYDLDFLFVGVQIVEEDVMPESCTDIKPPDGLFKAKFVNNSWVETKPQEEIDAILNAPKPLNELEQLKKQQADLTFTLMMNGVI